MDKAQQRRWLVLLVLLGVTLAAIFYPADQQFSQDVSLPAPQRLVVQRVLAPNVEKPTAPEWLAMEENPFAPRSWIAAPPAVAEVRTVAPVIVAEAAPAPPTPLPYRFLGQMHDGDDRVVYLGMGDQLVPARKGDVLDGRYKVTVIDAAHIEFETISSGLRQTLTLPAHDR